LASPPCAGDNEIGLAPAAPRAPQPGRPIDDGQPLAVALDQLGDDGLNLMSATLAPPHDQSRMSGERLAQRQRSWLDVKLP